VNGITYFTGPVERCDDHYRICGKNVFNFFGFKKISNNFCPTKQYTSSDGSLTVTFEYGTINLYDNRDNSKKRLHADGTTHYYATFTNNPFTNGGKITYVDDFC